MIDFVIARFWLTSTGGTAGHADLWAPGMLGACGAPCSLRGEELFTMITVHSGFTETSEQGFVLDTIT